MYPPGFWPWCLNYRLLHYTVNTSIDLFICSGKTRVGCPVDIILIRLYLQCSVAYILLYVWKPCLDFGSETISWMVHWSVSRSSCLGSDSYGPPALSSVSYYVGPLQHLRSYNWCICQSNSTLFSLHPPRRSVLS